MRALRWGLEIEIKLAGIQKRRTKDPADDGVSEHPMRRKESRRDRSNKTPECKVKK
jgi:hypothetical protein